jgi:hypothetical protein
LADVSAPLPPLSVRSAAEVSTTFCVACASEQGVAEKATLPFTPVHLYTIALLCGVGGCVSDCASAESQLNSVAASSATRVMVICIFPSP